MSQEPGSLYLGHELDPATAERTSVRVELPSDRLTTHGVIVGMTGSGKTGLGIVLLEEVLASGVPALILDPKGDMGNLLLSFPDFAPDDFEPWVDDGEARRKGLSRRELAEGEASTWRSGLEGSGVSPSRMRHLRDSVDLRIVTPGSTAGTPLNLVGDLSPPDVSWDEHGESIRDEIEGLVSGLLVMAGIEADPLTSREHILLSNLVEQSWRGGRSLDLPTLLRHIQDPPLRRLGVFELDQFYPSNDRMKLAMRLNGLMASPSFAEWLMGEPLDIQGLLFAPDGRPRGSIIHLAHLSESERTFVVTLLLTKFVTWMRKLPGTSELRVLIYADEVMGLAPPTAEPPTKRPILTLFKQARAHGVGFVVATQNPVDLDYKLMSNAGTWMVGRLQTERDKARILEGLRSASGEVDVEAWDARIGTLGKRHFLLKSARSATPTLFTTRWAMSYLRGPLTRAELLRLKPDHGDTRPPASTAAAPELGPDESSVPPKVADGVDVRYLDPAAPWLTGAGIDPSGSRLEPGLAVRVRLLFDERVGDIRHEETWEAVVFPLGERIDADSALVVDHDDRDFRREGPSDAAYVLSAAPLERADFFKAAETAIEERLFREETLALLRNQELKLYSRPGESADAFRQRCLDAAEDRADAEAERLRARFESRMKTAQRRLSEAERRVRELDVDVSQRRQQEMIAGAGEVLSLFLGGRRRVRSLSGISSRRSMTRRTQERLQSAAEKADEHRDSIEELGEELTEALEDIWSRWEATAGEVEPIEVPLERTDVRLDHMLLFWAARK
jgi:DNA helicase HerA-like ATPase